MLSGSNYGDGQRENLFWKANKFPIEVSMNYLRFATKAEKTFDFLIPAILTMIIRLFIAYMNPNTAIILKGIKDVNNQSRTFVSILAGFNIANYLVPYDSSTRWCFYYKCFC